MRKLILLAAMIAAPATAQQVADDSSSYAQGVFITSQDVTSCPYRLVQVIRVNATEDYDGPNNQPKVHGKLRAAALKLGADAVVRVERQGTHLSAWAWSRREYTGNAIRYVDRSCAPTSNPAKP